jgi:hypothetical protein
MMKTMGLKEKIWKRKKSKSRGHQRKMVTMRKWSKKRKIKKKNLEKKVRKKMLRKKRKRKVKNLLLLYNLENYLNVLLVVSE